MTCTDEVFGKCSVVPDVKHFDTDAALGTTVRLFWRQGFTATGIQDVVTATGVNRSSLYATFGGKKALYLAALRRYVEEQSVPAFEALGDGRGMPAIRDFFTGLIEARCSGPHAGFGCLVANAHAGPEGVDPAVREVLTLHHERLRQAMVPALLAAQARGQVRPDLDPATSADTLALVAYGINLRSRAGAAPTELTNMVDNLLATLGQAPGTDPSIRRPHH